MLLNYQDLSTVKKSIEVEIPADLISSESRRVADEFGRQAKIPGFRPGKVPAQVVRTRFAKEIQEEVMSRLLPLTFREAIADRGVEPVGDPRLQHIDAFIEGAPLKYKAEFEVKPHVELSDYRGLEIDDPKIEVTEHDVENMVERLREQASSYRPETERGLEDGDYAMIEITTSGADIRKHREIEVRRKKQSQVGELLLAAHDFDVPQTLVDEELGKSMQNYARFLASQGVDVEKAEIDWQKVRDDFLPEAVKRVKRGLILEAIAKQENLQVSDVEVDAEIRRAANEAERDFGEVKHRLKHDGGDEH